MNVKRWLQITLMALVALLVFAPGQALAKKSESGGVPVQVTVLDEDGKPIPTAVIRHPEEADRHRVNAMTGVWEADVLYLPDGSEMVFTPGMSITLEISAPGFVTKIVQYDVRKRRNRIEITLSKLEIDESGVEEPLIQFGRDKPREGG